jgi:hypothetical protein
MNSNMQAITPCPNEIATLQRLYGSPAIPPLEGVWSFQGMNPFKWGPGDKHMIALVGKWKDKDTWGPCLYDPQTAMWLIRYTLSPGPADLQFQYGPMGSNYQPIAGDWNGDGIYGIGLYNPANGQYLLRNSLTAGAAETIIQYGSGGNALGQGTIGNYKSTP